MICTFCGAPWHPATGHYYSARARSCWQCTVDFWRWMRAHTQPRKRRGKVTDFYGAAVRWMV